MRRWPVDSDGDYVDHHRRQDVEHAILYANRGWRWRLAVDQAMARICWRS